MPNRWTRVPDAAPPALPRWELAALPLADVFMVAMLSRPASGSLRVTWVTPATLLLAVVAGVVTAALGVLCIVALVRGGGWPLLVAAVLCAAVAAGCSAVGAVGAAQRRRG